MMVNDRSEVRFPEKMVFFNITSTSNALESECIRFRLKCTLPFLKLSRAIFLPFCVNLYSF